MDSATAACIAVLNREEGCRLRPYQDSIGVWTIGIGNTYIDGQHVAATTRPITQPQADALLLATVAPMLAKIRGWVGRQLTDQQWASLVSFSYNLGANTLYRSSLLTAVRQGYFDMAATMFAPYCHAGGRVIPGLVARRAREATAFGHPATMAMPSQSTADELNAAEEARHGG